MEHFRSLPPKARVMSAESPSVDILYDLAIKRYEYLTKAYDTANSRAAALFGFSTLAIGASSSAFKEMALRHFYAWIIVPIIIILVTIFVVITIYCFRAYRIKPLWLLPDPSLLYDDVADKSAHLVKRDILRHLIEPITNAGFSDEVSKKNRLIRTASLLLAIEVCLVFLASGLPYLPHRKMHMSDETPKDATPTEPPSATPPAPNVTPRPCPSTPNDPPCVLVKQPKEYMGKTVEVG